tara:strand:- start:53218 stop:53913 length:696 start_codon:yes stop_codon:yes gene_type:complete
VLTGEYFESDLEKKMTEEQLVHRIIDLYEEARSPHYASKRIVRGTSSCISSATEDLFADYFADKFKDVEIYVNQCFTQGRKRVQPDIALVKDDVVFSIIEIKQDIGWNRNQDEGVAKNRDLVLGLRGQQRNLPNKYSKEENKKVTFVDDLMRNVILVSDGNMSANRLQQNQRVFKSLRDTHRFLFLTTGKPHPNAYEMSCDERKSAITINHAGMESIVEAIRKDMVQAFAG